MVLELTASMANGEQKEKQKTFNESITIRDFYFTDSELRHIEECFDTDSAQVGTRTQSNKLTIMIIGYSNTSAANKKKEIVKYIRENIPINRRGISKDY